MSAPTKGEEAIFAEALRLPPEERAAYVTQATAGNPELRQAVESLLQSYAAGDFLEKAAAPQLRPTQITIPITEKPGETIGRYKLLQQIGEGGCGVVYMAEQLEPVRRRVALKIIKLGMDTRSVIARFEAERQALALMDHPNIAKVLDAGATETGRPYFVMELVRGMKITDYCDKLKLSTRARLDLFLQVCHATQHAHQKGIIHRDIKPSNILVSVDDGVPTLKVIDFGIAKATSGLRLTDRTLFTAFEQFIGTPAYMSPEQALLTNVDVDTRSDIYSLGVLLYELLTGKTPFDAEQLLAIGLDEMRRAIREQEPPRPSTRLSTLPGQELSTTAQRRGLNAPKLVSELRGDLDWIVMKALEKDRARRYETASGLASDIQRHLHNEPVVACPPSNLYRLEKMIRRNKLAFAAGSAVAASLVIGLTLSTILFFRERSAREEAAEQTASAQAVSDFLQQDLLRQADSRFQADANFRPDPNLTVREALERAAERIGDRFKDRPLQEAAVRMAIGNAMIGIGETERAIPHLKHALELRRAKLGSNHRDTLESMNRIGSVYCETGKLDQGLQLLEETLKLQKASLGPRDRDTLKSMINLSLAYHVARRLDQALPLAEETLKLHQANLGPDDPETLRSMRPLALVYLETGDFDRAFALIEETLKLRKARLAPDHPDTLLSMFDLARAYSTAGKTDQALLLYEEALELQKARQGPDHPSTLWSMNNLAIAYGNAGRGDQALLLFEETLKLRKARQGVDHPDTLSAMDSLGIAYLGTGRFDQGLLLLEETLQRKARLGRVYPNMLHTMRVLRMAYLRNGKLDQGRLAEFETLLRDKFGELRQRATNDPSQLISPVLDLVEVLLWQDKYAQAEDLLNDVISALIPNHPASAGLLRSRGQLRARRGQWKEAAADISQARDLNPENHELWHELAPLLIASSQLDAYQAHCRKSVERFRKSRNLRTLESIAMDCLILPNSGADLDLVGEMADTVAVAKRHWATPWFQLVKGLADYRRGLFTGAVEWLNKTLECCGEGSDRDLQAYLLLAMAHYQLKQTEQAQVAFAKGAAIHLAMPKLENGGGSGDWIIAQALMREAEALIEVGSATRAEGMDSVANDYFKAGKLDMALLLFKEALKLRNATFGPNHQDTLTSMHNLAVAFAMAKNYDRAEALYREALNHVRTPSSDALPQEVPVLGLVLHHLADILREQKKFSEARPLATEAVSLYRRHVDWPIDERLHAVSVLEAVLNDLGDSRELKAMLLERVEALRAAAEKDDLAALNNLAWIMATSSDSALRDGRTAVTFGERAVAKTGRKDFGILDTLAAAYAEAGEFAQAADAQREAIDLCQDQKAKDDLAARLKLYESNRPWREP